MKKRLMMALAAGALVAAMAPGVASADKGGIPNENSVVVRTPGNGSCFGVVAGVFYGTDNITWLVTKNGKTILTCRFGPADITFGTPPDRPVRETTAGGFAQIGPSGHGIAHFVLE